MSTKPDRQPTGRATLTRAWRKASASVQVGPPALDCAATEATLEPQPGRAVGPRAAAGESRGLAAFPRVAILGCDGLIGRHLVAACQRLDAHTIAAGRRADNPWHFDLTAHDSDLAARLAAAGCRWALLPAAMTHIASCEQRPDEARRVNLDGPLRLAGELASVGIVPVLFSSDYVFDGSEGAYDDDAQTSPINHYGWTKAELERRLPDVCGDDYLVVRLSKVYDVRHGDGTLLDEMAGRLAERRAVRAATDQVFCPTYVADVVHGVLALVRSSVRGVVNLCAPTAWTRHDLALAVADALSAARALVEPIRLAELGESFRRPLRTDMRCARLDAAARITFTPVEQAIAALAAGYSRRKEAA